MADYLHTFSALFRTFEDFFKDTKNPRFRGELYISTEAQRAVFTYGVMSVTCCKKSCSTSCVKQSGQVAPCGKQLAKQPCGADCVKPCCANK